MTSSYHPAHYIGSATMGDRKIAIWNCLTRWPHEDAAVASRCQQARGWMISSHACGLGRHRGPHECACGAARR